MKTFILGENGEDAKIVCQPALIERALVPAPLHQGLGQGKIVRFEEITRCPLEVQDSLLSVLSDRVLAIPELAGDAGMLFAREGFNVIATANTRDRGVNDMSAALKRRFNFETVFPIRNADEELALVKREAAKLLERSGVPQAPADDVLKVLVTCFRELRSAGAALGYLASRGEEGASSEVVTARIRRFGLPDSLGDFLAGLFALAREELSAAVDVLGAVDEVVAAWSDEEFLKAAPAMRLAFSWFPPLEREALARTILQRHGAGAVGAEAEAEALAWMRQKTAIRDQAAALALEERAGKRLARHGLA